VDLDVDDRVQRDAEADHTHGGRAVLLGDWMPKATFGYRTRAMEYGSAELRSLSVLMTIDEPRPGPPRLWAAAALIVVIVCLAGCGGGDRQRPAQAAGTTPAGADGDRVARTLASSVKEIDGGHLTDVVCERDERVARFWRCEGDWAKPGVTAEPDLRYRVRTARDGILTWTVEERAEFAGTAWPLPEAPDTITVESPAFRPSSTIPQRFTCDGENTSPPLRWKHIPPAARSLALVVEDASVRGFVHWSVVDIPVTTTSVNPRRVPAGGTETLNSFGETSYLGPCPAEDDLSTGYLFVVLAYP
jgi:Raf kinase inhibitor-like YbhB/YbcL family protein